MRVSIVGSGYVGLVSGAGLSDVGHHVLCMDIDQDRIAGLRRGEVPIYEPGLDDMIARNAGQGRLEFTADIQQAVEHAEVLFIAVGTPPDEDGSADLSHVLAVAASVGASGSSVLRISPPAVSTRVSTEPLSLRAGLSGSSVHTPSTTNL